MTTFNITRDSQDSYGFSIVLDEILTAGITVRWEIVPIGELPIALSTPLTGMTTFSTSDSVGTTKSADVSIVASNLHGFSRDFEIRLYNDDTDALLLSKAELLEGDRSLIGDRDISLSGGGDRNIIGLGSTDEISSAGGGVGDDTYIVTRFQYGHVVISDSDGGANLVKFDYGVTIKAYSEASDVVFGNFIIQSVTLTLSTDATIKINFPAGRFSYQLGNGDVLNYADFKTAIGVTLTPDPNDDPRADELLNPHAVNSFTSLPELSAMREEAGVESSLGGAGNEDILTLASDYDLASSGGVGDDTYIVTRFQYGHVVISDSDGGANLVKFDYGVTIKAYSEASDVVFGNFIIQSVTLTLSTDATIKINFPAGRFSYQLGNGDVLNYADFKTAIGVTLTPDPNDDPRADELLNEYTVPLPPIDGNHLPVFGQGAYFASIDLGDMAGDAVIMLTATDVDVVAGEQTLSYHITAGNSGGLFEIAESTGAITLARAPDAILDAQGYTLTIEVRDSNDPAGVDRATLTIAGFNNVTEDAAVQYAYPEERGVAHSITTSQQAEVALLTTADDADSDAASVTEITQDRVDENGNTVTETIGYRATGTYGVFEYYLFGKGWKYTVNDDATETIAKAGARISEDFVFEITPSGGGATYKTTITANVASNFSYVETEGTLDVSDTDITDITILTTSGDAVLVRTDGDIVTASTSWGDLEFNTKTGAWVYTLNNNDPDFQAMKSSDTPLTETFVVEITKTGGTKATENIVININGADEDIYFVDADGNEVDTLPGSAEITTTHFFFS